MCILAERMRTKGPSKNLEILLYDILKLEVLPETYNSPATWALLRMDYYHLSKCYKNAKFGNLCQLANSGLEEER